MDCKLDSSKDSNIKSSDTKSYASCDVAFSEHSDNASCLHSDVTSCEHSLDIHLDCDVHTKSSNEVCNVSSDSASSVHTDNGIDLAYNPNGETNYKLGENERIDDLCQDGVSSHNSSSVHTDNGIDFSSNPNGETNYKLNENERIDDLCQDGLKLIQNKTLFCFGVDAVALASVVKANKSDTVLDLCTGNGVIPILLSSKTSCSDFSCVELQQKSYELLCKNIELNGLQDKIKAYNDDIKTFKLKKEVSVITCNPPYMNNTGAKNLKDELTIARHEVALNLDDIVKCVDRNLKYGGKFYMVHRAERMVDIFAKLRQHAIEPKVVHFIKHKNATDKINLIIVEAIKGAKPSLKLKDLYLT